MGPSIRSAVMLYIIKACFTFIGKLYMRLRHGKDHSEILNKEYEGFYTGVGTRIFRYIIAVLFIIFYIYIVTRVILFYTGSSI